MSLDYYKEGYENIWQISGCDGDFKYVVVGRVDKEIQIGAAFPETI